MRYLLYALLVVTIYLELTNGLSLFSQSGQSAIALSGTFTAVATCLSIGGLLLIPGLIGLFMKKNWGFGVSAVGLGLSILGGVLTITGGKFFLLPTVAPLITLILLFITKKS